MAWRAANPNVSDINLHALRKGADVFAAIASPLDSHPLARGGGELRQHVGCDRPSARSTERGGNALRVGLRLIARRLERRDALFQRSEEHTSELQSLMRISYAVFCLKKKKQIPIP